MSHLQPWERSAVQEISAILYELAYGSFESKRSLGERLRNAAEAIELVAEPALSEAEQIIAWRQRLSELTQQPPDESH